MHGYRSGGFVRPALACALVAGLCTACGGDAAGPSEPEPTPPSVTRVEITPDSAVLSIGQTRGFSATAFNASGGVMSGSGVGWSSSDAAVATIDDGGVATGVGAGTARITATVDGVTASATVRVPAPKPARVTITPDSADLWVGQTQDFSAKAFDDADEELTGRTVEWSSSDTDVVSIGDEGVATGTGPGSATVTATVDGVSASVSIQVRENPVKSTSYENFKESGYQPVSIPLPPTAVWYDTYTEYTHAFGDFYGRGAGTQDMFTATLTYDPEGTEAEAEGHRAVYRFWRSENGTYVEDSSIMSMAVAPCVNPRKALVADFNLDGRPDIFIACIGFDGRSFPGETNQILLSQSGGGYLLQEASPDVGFWHSAAAGDLDGDGYADVVAVAGNDRSVFLNNGDGTFVRETINRLPGSTEHQFAGRIYFSVELIDVDEDGHLDLLLGGHEWSWSGDGTPGGEGNQQTVTAVWLNPGNNDFSAADSVQIPVVPDEGVVLDFAVTGTGPTRTLWVLRTGGNEGEERYYDSAVLQRFDWGSRTSSIVYDQYPAAWPAWIIPYTRGGTLYIGSSDLRTPLEYAVQ